MNTERAPAVALLVIAILAIGKSVWAVMAPELFKKFAGGWVKVAHHVNTLLGILCVLVAGVLLVCVLLDQSLVNWVVAVLSGFAVYAASLYFRRESFEKAARLLVLDRSAMVIRAWGVAGILIAAVLLWIAVRGL